MTHAEQLLKPRYKVMAHYPGSPYEVGQILTPDENGAFAGLVGSPLIGSYPKIFERLQWWQERVPALMPRYVKNAVDGSVFKIEELNNHTPSDVWVRHFKYMGWHSLYDLLPSTEEEYNQQKPTGKEEGKP